MMTFIFWTALGICVGCAFASFFEWTLHRFLMHRPLGRFRYPYERHHLLHHRIFKADHTYHLIHEQDKVTIPMAWWNGPVLVAVSASPFLVIAILSHKWGLACGAAIACMCYYAAYEYIHWCMHLPKKRYVERSGIYFRLNGHHLLHHRYMNKNFNVVCPLSRLVFGNTAAAVENPLQQAMCPALPNVQPKTRPSPTLPVLGGAR